MVELAREWVVLPMPFLMGLVLVVLTSRWRRLSRGLLFGLTAAFALSATPVVSESGGRAMASLVPVMSGDSYRDVVIVVPTAGIQGSKASGYWPSTTSAERVMAAIEAAAANRIETIILSGGDPAELGTAEATVLATYFQSRTPARLLVDASAKNTAQSGPGVATLLTGKPRVDGQNVLLVTSCPHLLRAAASLRASGFRVMRTADLACGTVGARSRLGRYWPSSAGLLQAEAVSHELVGLVWGAIRGDFSLGDVFADR